MNTNDNHEPASTHSPTSVIHVRVDYHLAEEIRRIARAERISVRAVVERFLSQGISATIPPPTQQLYTETPPFNGSGEVSWSNPEFRAHDLRHWLWEGWAHHVLWSAKLKQDGNTTGLAYTFHKRRALLRYQEVLKELGLAETQYPFAQALADGFKAIWGEPIDGQPGSTATSSENQEPDEPPTTKGSSEE